MSALRRTFPTWVGSIASLVRICLAAAVLAGALTVALRGYSYSAPKPYRCSTPAGVLKVAPARPEPLTWYDSAHPPPALTNQITAIASHLYPGRSGTMAAHVRNTGSANGIPSIAITELTDGIGLSGNIEVAITYTSSLRPGVTHAVAAGTLAQLAASGRAYAAPVRLSVYSACSRETGTWTIRVAVPESAENTIQNQWCMCSVRFGLTGVPR